VARWLVAEKSSTLRVTSVRLCTSAIAATSASRSAADQYLPLSSTVRAKKACRINPRNKSVYRRRFGLTLARMTSTASARAFGSVHHRSGKRAWKINGENKSVPHRGNGLTFARMRNALLLRIASTSLGRLRPRGSRERHPPSWPGLTGHPSRERPRAMESLRRASFANTLPRASLRAGWMAATGAPRRQRKWGDPSRFSEVRMGTFLYAAAGAAAGGRGVCGFDENESL
jgi:hypothetical protein